jgi:predicted ATPase
MTSGSRVLICTSFRILMAKRLEIRGLIGLLIGEQGVGKGSNLLSLVMKIGHGK